MTQRISLITLILAFGLALPAEAINPKNEVSPEFVSIGPTGGIDSEYVAVPDKYAAKPGRFELHLTLEEHRFNGDVIFLGEQTVPLMNTTLVTENGPDGRDVFDVAWSTSGIEANSDVYACVEIIDLMNGNVRGDLHCQTLTPVQ